MGSCNHKSTRHTNFQVYLASSISLLVLFPNPTKATEIYDYDDDQTGSRYKEAIIPIVGYLVIMAAIVICSYLRKRQSSNSATEEEYSVTVEATRKLEARVIEAFPVLDYIGPSDQFRFTECHICLEELEQGESVLMLPACGHGYHKDCVLTWMTTRDSRCPDCRHDYAK